MAEIDIVFSLTLRSFVAYRLLSAFSCPSFRSLVLEGYGRFRAKRSRVGSTHSAVVRELLLRELNWGKS
jgi:hypothetical protein